MSIDDPGIIDAAGIDKSSGEVVLTIFDHLGWNNERDHLVLLQAKLNRYLGFLEAGEMAESYVEGLGRPVRIDVVFRYQPSPGASDFLAKATPVVSEYAAQLTWQVASDFSST